MYKTSVRCNMCRETIEVTGNNFMQDWCAEPVRDIKAHIHYNHRHGKGYLTTMGLLKRVLWLVIAFALCIILFPIWLITWPFWKLHELVSG